MPEGIEARVTALENWKDSMEKILVKAGDRVWLKARNGPYIGVDNGEPGRPVNTGAPGNTRGKGQDERFVIEKE